MERPRVVMSVGASVDGKVALTKQQILMQQPSGRLWADMTPPDAEPLHEDFLELVRQQYGCTGAEVMTNPGDKNDVFVIHRFPALETAQEFAGSGELKQAMGRAGVNGAPRVEIATEV